MRLRVRLNGPFVNSYTAAAVQCGTVVSRRCGWTVLEYGGTVLSRRCGWRTSKTDCTPRRYAVRRRALQSQSQSSAVAVAVTVQSQCSRSRSHSHSPVQPPSSRFSFQPSHSPVQSSPVHVQPSPRCVAAQARNRELLAARDAEARLHRIVTAPPFPRTLYYTLPSAVTVL